MAMGNEWIWWTRRQARPWWLWRRRWRWRWRRRIWGALAAQAQGIQSIWPHWGQPRARPTLPDDEGMNSVSASIISTSIATGGVGLRRRISKGKQPSMSGAGALSALSRHEHEKELSASTWSLAQVELPISRKRLRRRKLQDVGRTPTKVELNRKMTTQCPDAIPHADDDDFLPGITCVAALSSEYESTKRSTTDTIDSNHA